MCLTKIRAIMLNNRAKRDSKKLLESIGIVKGQTVADIGSGGGYFSERFANKTLGKLLKTLGTGLSVSITDIRYIS